MKAKKSKRMRVLGCAILALFAFVGQAAGCIIVEETCLEGDLTCNGDYVEECIDNSWRTIDDCFSFCGGTCGYLNDEVVCVCEL
jgi:hypothetical protein